MPRTPRVTAAETLRALSRDGWVMLSGSSPAILRHPTKPGYVAVPRHKTLEAIIEQAGLTVEEFRRLL